MSKKFNNGPCAFGAGAVAAGNIIGGYSGGRIGGVHYGSESRPGDIGGVFLNGDGDSSPEHVSMHTEQEERQRKPRRPRDDIPELVKVTIDVHNDAKDGIDGLDIDLAEMLQFHIDNVRKEVPDGRIILVNVKGDVKRLLVESSSLVRIDGDVHELKPKECNVEIAHNVMNGIKMRDGDVTVKGDITGGVTQETGNITAKANIRGNVSTVNGVVNATKICGEVSAVNGTIIRN